MNNKEEIKRIYKEFLSKVNSDMTLDQAYKAVGIKQMDSEIHVTGRKAVELFYKYLIANL